MPDLLVTVGADISQYNNAMQSIGSTATSASNAVVSSLNNQQKSIEQLTIKMASYQQVVYKATDPAVIVEYNAKIQQLNAEIQQMSNLGKQGFNALGNGAVSASMRFQQMRSGISAARDGVLAFSTSGQTAERSLLAMGHHITSLVNETGSIKSAFGALASSLMGAGGIILAISLAAELWSKYQDSQEKAAQSTKDYVDTISSVRQAELQGNQDGATEITRLRLLYEATQNHALSMQQRNQAYDELANKYPKFFSNSDREKTLLGENAQAYDSLAKSILAAASAKAYENQIGQNANRSFENDQKILDELKKQAELRKVISEERRKSELSTSGREGTGGGQSLAEASAVDELGASIKRVNDLRTDSRKLIEQNGKLAQLALENEVKAGFKTEGEIDAKNQKTKEQITGLDLLKQKLSEAQTALQDSIVAGKTGDKDFNSPLLQQIKTLQEAIDKAMSTYNVLMGLAARNAPLEAHGLGSQRGMGQGVDNGGLLENSGVRSFSSDQLGNAGLGKTNDEVVASMQKGVAAFKDQTEWAYQARLAMEHYNEEMKAVNNITTLFGGGLTRAFESALRGTQSFVSAMGSFLLQLIEKLIAAAAAAALLDVLLTATGFGGAVSFSSLFGQLSGFKNLFGGTSAGSSSVQGFATGGIFTQPTLGIFGERGPEAIVTPDHLADFAGIQKGGNNSDTDYGRKIIGVFKGSDFQLLSVRSAKTKSRTS